MKQAEAVGIVAVFGSAFRTEITETTSKLWARELVNYEVSDALEACENLAKGLRFMPSLADMVTEIRACRNRRLVAPPLPSGSYYPFAQFLHEHPDMAERVKKLQGGVVGHTFATLLEGEMK